MSREEDNEIEHYGDERISSFDAKIPRWLFWAYIILPIWGIIWFIIYWNGSIGWSDPDHWQGLQRAANTKFPISNQNSPNP